MGWDAWEQIFTQFLWPGCKQALLKISWDTSGVNVFKHLLNLSSSALSLWAGFFNVRLSVVAHFWHIWMKHLWQPKLEFRSLWEQWGNPAHWWRPMSLHDRGQGKSSIVRKGNTSWTDTNISLKTKENTGFLEQMASLFCVSIVRFVTIMDYVSEGFGKLFSSSAWGHKQKGF